MAEWLEKQNFSWVKSERTYKLIFFTLDVGLA